MILLVFVILVAALFWFANDQSALYRNKSERKSNGAGKKNIATNTKGGGVCQVCPGCISRKGDIFFPAGDDNDAATRLPN